MRHGPCRFLPFVSFDPLPAGDTAVPQRDKWIGEMNGRDGPIPHATWTRNSSGEKKKENVSNAVWERRGVGERKERGKKSGIPEMSEYPKQGMERAIEKKDPLTLH